MFLKLVGLSLSKADANRSMMSQSVDGAIFHLRMLVLVPNMLDSSRSQQIDLDDDVFGSSK